MTIKELKKILNLLPEDSIITTGETRTTLYVTTDYEKNDKNLYHGLFISANNGPLIWVEVDRKIPGE